MPNNLLLSADGISYNAQSLNVSESQKTEYANALYHRIFDDFFVPKNRPGGYWSSHWYGGLVGNQSFLQGWFNSDGNYGWMLMLSFAYIAMFITGMNDGQGIGKKLILYKTYLD